MNEWHAYLESRGRNQRSQRNTREKEKICSFLEEIMENKQILTEKDCKILNRLIDIIIVCCNVLVGMQQKTYWVQPECSKEVGNLWWRIYNLISGKSVNLQNRLQKKTIALILNVIAVKLCCQEQSTFHGISQAYSLPYTSLLFKEMLYFKKCQLNRDVTACEISDFKK